MLRRNCALLCALASGGGARGKPQPDPAASGAAAASTAPVAAAAPSGGWMTGAAWASIGSEFKNVSEEKYLRVVPDGFLTPRATTEVQPAEALLSQVLSDLGERYKGIDVRDPSTLKEYEGESARSLTLGTQVKAVAEFISGHLAHHVSLQEWKVLFDLKHVEMDLTYWLYVLHVHMVSRRATSIPITKWSRRRETLEEVLYTMFDSWVHTSEEVMGRPPLSKIRHYIRDMYYVTATNLEEAMLHDGPGGDLMLLGVLVKFCPLPRPEDVPLYTYYTLVHYIRFHTALFDRMDDEQFSIGNFNFLPPNDPQIFQPYGEVELDEVIRQWAAEGHESWFTSAGARPPPAGEGAAAATAAATSSDNSNK